MIKRFLKPSLFLLLISISPLLFSQGVSINGNGTTPSTNAILDLNSGNSLNQGIIIPHVELGSSLSTFGLVGSATSKDTGMLIYNSISTRQPIGFYYWNGTTWVGDGTSSNWSQTGNSGTTVGTNFIGTTDSMPIEIKVHNQFAGYIDYYSKENTFYGRAAGQVNTGTLNTAIGQQALQRNTSGSVNTAIGVESLNNNSTGNYNTAVGYGSLEGGTNNNGCTAIGYQDIPFATSGNTRCTMVGMDAGYYSSGCNGNVAEGEYSLYNTTGSSNSGGSFNTAVGDSALYTNTSGSYNTAIGFHANVGSNNLTNATAIGNGASATASNQIVLGNSAVTQVSIASTNLTGGTPTNTTTPVAWMKVYVGGTLYYMPLYQ